MAEQDVTHLMYRYREACRLLWNGFLRDFDANGHIYLDDERYCDFHRVQDALFVPIVLREIGRESTRFRFGWIDSPVLDFLRVVARPNTEILVNRESAHAGNQYWDGLPKHVPAEIDLRFKDYFDWDVIGYRDLAYYLTRIVACAAYPEIVGRDALVRVMNCRVVAVDAT
jgi:hypothetical protein